MLSYLRHLDRENNQIKTLSITLSNLDNHPKHLKLIKLSSHIRKTRAKLLNNYTKINLPW